MKVRLLLPVVIVALTLATGASAFQDVGCWKIGSEEVTLARSTTTSDHLFKATIRDRESNRVITISSPTYMEKVQQSTIIGNHLVVLGTGGAIDEALLGALKAPNVVQRAIARYMVIIGGKWLVSVEWYPDHVFPPQYANDVLLVRDLEREADQGATRSSDLQRSLIRSAGLPVYPVSFAKAVSYQNVQEDSKITSNIYSQTLTSLPENRLVFIASYGPADGFSPQILVTIDLLKPAGSAISIKTYSIENFYRQLGTPTGQILQIDHLEVVNATTLNVVFTEGAYKVDKLSVAVSK